MNRAKTWFITGVSRGFGRVWARAALERGDRVAGALRNPDDVAALVSEFGESFLPIRMDVTDRAAVFAGVDTARERLGNFDVVVNNAGYGLFGMVEELSEADVRDQLETNLFGAVWVTQAVLPVLRQNGGGRLIQVSSVGGVLAHADLGGYHASKWALEGLSQALAEEVRSFGIRVTILEPVGYATDWRGSSAVRAVGMPEYQALRDARAAQPPPTAILGDPAAVGGAMLVLADHPEPPLRCFLGDGGVERVRAEYERRLEEWEEWSAWSTTAHRV